MFFTIATVAILCMEVIPIEPVNLMVPGLEMLLLVSYKVSNFECIIKLMWFYVIIIQCHYTTFNGVSSLFVS